jgi:hypothetical protein
MLAQINVCFQKGPANRPMMRLGRDPSVRSTTGLGGIPTACFQAERYTTLTFVHGSHRSKRPTFVHRGKLKKSFPPISKGHLAIAHFPTHEKLTGLPDVNSLLGCRLKLSGLYGQENGRFPYIRGPLRVRGELWERYSEFLP